jgi:hypothetical protein
MYLASLVGRLLRILAFQSFQSFVLSKCVLIRPRLSYPGLPDGIPIFMPKIPIRVNLGVPWNVKCWYTYFMAIWCFYGQMVYFVIIWYIFPALVFFTKKILATLFAPLDCFTFFCRRLSKTQFFVPR